MKPVRFAGEHSLRHPFGLGLGGKSGLPLAAEVWGHWPLGDRWDWTPGGVTGGKLVMWTMTVIFFLGKPTLFDIYLNVYGFLKIVINCNGIGHLQMMGLLGFPTSKLGVSNCK